MIKGQCSIDDQRTMRVGERLENSALPFITSQACAILTLLFIVLAERFSDQYQYLGKQVAQMQQT